MKNKYLDVVIQRPLKFKEYKEGQLAFLLLSGYYYSWCVFTVIIIMNQETKPNVFSEEKDLKSSHCWRSVANYFA